jgi:hypothetical protein
MVTGLRFESLCTSDSETVIRQNTAVPRAEPTCSATESGLYRIFQKKVTGQDFLHFTHFLRYCFTANSVLYLINSIFTIYSR